MIHYFPDVTAEYRTTPPLKEVTESPDGRAFVGTREALIASGHFRAEWFPGEPGMRRHTSSVHHDGREISISRRSPRLFKGFVGFTRDEYANRRALRETKRRLEALHNELAAIPSSVDEYREQLSGAHLASSAPLSSLGRGDERTGGYHLDDDAYFEIADLQRRIITVIHRGKVEHDPAKREAVLREVYAHHGEELPPVNGFAQFLARVSTPGAQLDEGEGPTT